jgi:hypothetical protein
MVKWELIWKETAIACFIVLLEKSYNENAVWIASTGEIRRCVPPEQNVKCAIPGKETYSMIHCLCGCYNGSTFVKFNKCSVSYRTECTYINLRIFRGQEPQRDGILSGNASHIWGFQFKFLSNIAFPTGFRNLPYTSQEIQVINI